MCGALLQLPLSHGTGRGTGTMSMDIGEQVYGHGNDHGIRVDRHGEEHGNHVL